MIHRGKAVEALVVGIAMSLISSSATLAGSFVLVAGCDTAGSPIPAVFQGVAQFDFMWGVLLAP